MGRGPHLAFHVDENATLFAPYKFEYSDLNITPNPAELGQTATVSFNVTNTGGKGDLKGEDVDLIYKGTTTLSKTVHLVDDETKRIEFKLTGDQLNETGRHSIRVEDLRETLLIEDKKEDKSQPTGAPSSSRRGRIIPGFEVIYGVSSIALVVYLMVNRGRK
ncbi:MAG: hypothetical protein MOIL_01350 [Candidatus Methanolliviera sp. GoM_oil]|nr:MAG: hypothetical protein MOIL_01350 [Candidatus Methanolliviera sp. GoM_oil]